MRGRVGVVIVSYNVRLYLQRCLSALFSCAAAEGIELVVCVVDNGSSDGSAQMVAQMFPHAVLLANACNRGFSAATNQGIKLVAADDGAQVDAVLLLNPDAELQPGVLPLLLSDMRERSRAAVIGPGLRYATGQLQHSAFRFPGLWQIALEFFCPHPLLLESWLNGRYPVQERSLEPFECDHPLGAAMLVRPSALMEVGPLDEAFFIYCEEVDWCWRAKRLGWQVWSDPRAVVVHHAAKSTSQQRGRTLVALWRSRYQLVDKHRSAAFGLLAHALIRVGAWRHMHMAYRAGDWQAATALEEIASLRWPVDRRGNRSHL